MIVRHLIIIDRYKNVSHLLFLWKHVSNENTAWLMFFLNKTGLWIYSYLKAEIWDNYFEKLNKQDN
jgi:hypothetical protein